MGTVCHKEKKISSPKENIQRHIQGEEILDESGVNRIAVEREDQRSPETKYDNEEDVQRNLGLLSESPFENKPDGILQSVDNKRPNSIMQVDPSKNRQRIMSEESSIFVKPSENSDMKTFTGNGNHTVR